MSKCFTSRTGVKIQGLLGVIDIAKCAMFEKDLRKHISVIGKTIFV